MELRGKVALVSGATGGLGTVIARALAAEGLHVALTYFSHREEGAALCREIEARGTKAVLVQLDQNDPASCEDAAEAAVTALGRLDVLINNAAVNQPVPFQDIDGLTPEIWDRVININLRGPFLLTRAAVRHMKQNDQGRIVNIAGFPGLVPMGSSVALAVSKAGLIHLTRCLAVALAPSISVNCVAPGLMEGTQMTARLRPEAIAALQEKAVLKRTTSLEDVARQVVLFCRADSVIGQTLVIDGGIAFH
jgi:3-oxoacyl-[acyl-carrier protein] reductase